jgi:hypothetical protein
MSALLYSALPLSSMNIGIADIFIVLVVGAVVVLLVTLIKELKTMFTDL